MNLINYKRQIFPHNNYRIITLEQEKMFLSQIRLEREVEKETPSYEIIIR